MIKIYNDFEKVQQINSDDHNWVFSQLEEYISLRQRLRQALDDQYHNYTFYIQHRLLAEWLRDLRDYSSDRLLWEEVNLREKFYRKFGCLPPNELDDISIQKLNIFDLCFPTNLEVDDPTGWILGQCLDIIWKPIKPNSEHFVDLVAWVIKAEQIEEMLIPLANKRLKQWQQFDKRYQIFLDGHWTVAGQKILLKWAVKKYPNNFSLHQQLISVPEVDCHRYRKLVINVLKKYKRELHHFWSIMFATSLLPDIMDTINLMSGLTHTELNVLMDWLKANPIYLTSPLLDTISSHFAYLPESEKIIKQLKILLPPNIPHTPDNTWTTEKWLLWVTNEYMPYFAWILRHNQGRDTQIALANRFSDWLVSYYHNLMFDKNAPFITNQLSYLQKIFETNQADVVFWLIVDGLTWWQGEGLVKNFVKHGLNISHVEPNLSALPSLTFISKTALVQGYLEQTTKKQTIKKLLENQLYSDYIIYTQTGQFETAISSGLQHGIHVLLYNILDTHNHEAKNFTDDESVEGYLCLLARLTNDFFKKSTYQGLQARALVSSDHGSTLLPPNTKVLNIPSFAQLVDDKNTLDNNIFDKGKNMYQRTRACAIKKLPSEDELIQLEDWYLLRQDVFNLPQHFLIPKGYAAVKRRAKGWTHGGATPEEIVTAFIEVQSEEIDIIPPVIKIEGFLSPTQESSLKITITNPNSIPLYTVHFTFLNMQLLVEVVPKILSNNPIIISNVLAPIATSKRKIQIIEWQLTCKVGGKPKQFIGQEEIPVRRFQISEVDDLFEDML